MSSQIITKLEFLRRYYRIVKFPCKGQNSAVLVATIAHFAANEDDIEIKTVRSSKKISTVS